MGGPDSDILLQKLSPLDDNINVIFPLKDPTLKICNGHWQSVSLREMQKVHKRLIAVGPVRTKMSSARIIWVRGDPTVLDFPVT